MNFSIVILHYNLIEDTRKCVDSLLLLLNHAISSQVKIIIVDNGSPNKSGDELEMIYQGFKEITILKSKKNLGFSCGNNLGYTYAVENQSPDFIILSNNDVEILQYHFFENIEQIFQKNNFALLGPDVYNPLTKVHQSPLFTDTIVNTSYVNKRLIMIKLRTIRDFLKIIAPIILNLVEYLKKSKKNNSSELYQENVCIHGSFMIFSKKFIEIFPSGLFNKTFMYGEEDILLYLCQKNNLKIIYDPNIQIIHYEEKSTVSNFKSRYSAMRFKNKHMYLSMIQLRNLLMNRKNDGRGKNENSIFKSC